MGSEWLAAIESYYQSPAVRARVAEYCGGRPAAPESFSCHGLAAYGGRKQRVEADGAPTPLANAAFDQVLAEGADVCRALADRGGTLLQLDVDYVSPADPAAPYRHPALVMERLEPVHGALLEVFAACGISPLVLTTGRGYHYVARARLNGPLHEALVALGAAGRPARLDRLDCAHEGAGRVVEHIAHEAMHRLRGRTTVPVMLADVPPPGGGPFVCLDQSAYGDPVRSRHTRCAFSANQKASMQGATAERPFVFVVPRSGQPWADLLVCREDAAEASRWAEASRVAIPDVVEGVELLEGYRRSRVSGFHAFFDRGPEVPREEWPFTYDSLDPWAFPACVAIPLAYPNPLLLRPEYLRTICLVLWGLGWHPRSIAALVRSRFEHDLGWRPPFSRYDPALRAAFYVRVLCGALVDDLDSPDRFTCATQKDSGLCEPERCSADAQRLFDALAPSLRVASRP